MPFNKEFKQRPGSILDEPYVVSILIMLLAEPEIYATAFKKKLSTNYNTFRDLAETMERMDLITITPVNRPRLTHVIKLTKKGKEVAKLVKEAVDLVGPIPPEC